MLETDADRLSRIRALGGVVVSAPAGQFEALFDVDHVGIGDVPVDSASPRLTASSSDLERCQVHQGTALVVAGNTYVAQSIQPDGLGMAYVILEGP